MDFTFVAGLAGGLLTLATFFGISWKMLRFIFRVDNALPTLLNIAQQFETNHGSTIKDKIDKIQLQGETAVAAAEIAKAVALEANQTAKLVATTNAKIVEELTSTQTTELLDFRKYLHDSIHDLKTEMSHFVLALIENGEKTNSVARKIEELEPYIVRSREDRK
jgi:hypothetical protein